MSPRYLVRAAVADDAEAYVRCHLACLVETYVDSGLMPAAFGEEHWAEVETSIAERRDALVRSHEALAERREPHRRYWVAMDGDEVVGVVSSGPGRDHWDDIDPPPPVGFNLSHLYTRRSTHGTGLGETLFATAVPEDMPTYLWIIDNNPRAERFYAKHGFVHEGLTVVTHESWFNVTMSRMIRP